MSSIYDSNEDWISLQFAMNVFDDASLVGKQFWIGASVTMDSDFIWTGQYLVEIDAKVDISTVRFLFLSFLPYLYIPNFLSCLSPQNISF